MQGLTSGLGNDSDRAVQLKVSGGQWQKGKCTHDFSPAAAWLATPDEVDART
jgi:2,4-diketo-3-deoxy-L-fuconate hydrolase